MHRLAFLIIVLLGDGTAMAQVTITPESLTHYNECLNDAISNNKVTQRKGKIQYVCFGSIARNWFNSLDLDTQRDVNDRRGRFISRYYGASGYCAHQIETAEGDATNGYVCEIDAQAPE